MTDNTKKSGIQNFTVGNTQETWVLYHNPFSLCSRKVRFCLDEYKIEYKSEPIDLIETGKYGVAEKSFLKINPEATVPVLLFEGKPIYESHEQIKFLVNNIASNTPILPSEKSKQGEMDYWIKKSSLVGDPILNQDIYAGNCIGPLTFPLFATMIRYVPLREIIKGLFNHPKKERVLLFLTLKVLGLKTLNSKKLISLLKKSLSNLNSHFLDLEEHLDKSKQMWILGDDFSLADVSWSVIIHRIHECGWQNFLLKDKPNIKEYYKILCARKSFQSSVIDVDHPLVSKGIYDLKKKLDEESSIYRTYKTICNQ